MTEKTIPELHHSIGKLIENKIQIESLLKEAEEVLEDLKCFVCRGMGAYLFQGKMLPCKRCGGSGDDIEAKKALTRISEYRGKK